MIYVCSDIHGCFSEFKCLLETVDFKDEDTMYILGDVLDRGEEPIALLQYVMSKDNIVLLKGNHENDAFLLLTALVNSIDDVSVKSHLSMDLYKVISAWVNENGGGPTLKQFMDLDNDERHRILDYLSKLDTYKLISVNGRNYLLSHTFNDELYDENKSLSDYDESCFVYGYIDFDNCYLKDTYHITGHVPVQLTRSDKQALILEYKNHINIDCGMVYGGRLSCICLDNNRHYYIGEN